MKLRIGSYNVRGLCARTARTKLRGFISSFNPQLDILAVQEHKLRSTNINFFTTSIWPQAKVFLLPASDGVHAQRNPSVSGGKGGVILAVSPSIASLIVNSGLLPANGGLWLHLDTADGRKLGIAAIYAPNSAAERTTLWDALETALDTSRSWIVAGDFNMITNSLDQVGGTAKVVTGEENSSWTRFINAYDLIDTFTRRDGQLNYTIDRIYADATLLANRLSSEIIPGSELSDHLPIVTTFKLQHQQGHHKSDYRVSIAVLQDPTLKTNLTRLWGQWQNKHECMGSSPLITLKACLKRSVKYCQIWGKKTAIKRKEKQNRLTLKVHGLLLQLQSDPSNISSQLKLEEVQHDLSSWETEKARWIQHLLDRNWEEEGERSTKLFFNSIKSRKKQTTVHALQDDAGVLHTENDKILQLASEYFVNILQEPPVQTTQQLAAEDILSKVQAQVTMLERESLQRLFTGEELHNAAKLLGRSKCPGPDGIPLEFFLLFWETVSPLLLRATTHGLQNGTLLPFFNKGVITLLHKDGDNTLLKNKRPITLLNSVYKIWAKALQIRLSPVLQRLISWEQNAFLPGRHLHSTVFLCSEALFEAKLIQQDSVLLKIDFRKAFDTLRWDFLYEAMRKMNFGDTFIALVQTVNTGASTCLRINNSTSSTFQISRSVRQGCPLSPLLFTIAIQVLTDVVTDLLHTGHLRGIDLPAIGIQYCQGYFADDSHFLLAADQHVLLNAKQILHSFGLASGLEVQWSKSKARWISESNPKPTWVLQLDWIWAEQDETDKFLGFLFKDGLDEQAIHDMALEKINKKINAPFYRSTTIHGRVVLANYIIYGIIWFLLPLWSADKQKIRSIERAILTYVWGGNENTRVRHRIAEKILHQRKADGGLGLMSLQAQTQACVAKQVRWAFSPGSHPLKAWLLHKFNSIALQRWGASEHTWILSPAKGSWSPMSALSGSFARLKSAGIQELGDITTDGKAALPLTIAPPPGSPQPLLLSKAYERIVDSTPRHSSSFRCPSKFAATPANNPTWVRTPPTRLLLSWEDKASIIASLQWKDQSGFLSAPNANIRRIASTDTKLVLTRLRRWEVSHHFDSKDPHTWKKLWSRQRPIKYSVLQWLIYFHAVLTNTWRHPQTTRNQDETWCLCCSDRAAEDIEHLFWKCRSVKDTWRWAIDVLHTAFPETRRWTPTFRHALLGAEIPSYCKMASQWWEKWRLAIIWVLWTQRNEKVFRDTEPSSHKAKVTAWHRLVIQTRKEWERHCAHLAGSDLTLARRSQLDRKKGRKLALITLRFSIQGQRLFTTWRPS
ncbi:hypothetical protein R1sor_022736 [Riccia sorocarpa]|uniref:Reverse transcriptase domain-containing protein n=1 Tax=Riccia sorocarpa TaxID=122646 RepID=A0ABD3GP03_9MARC